jgi:5-methylcytosine-specific restriction endonuclease McrA
MVVHHIDGSGKSDDRAGSLINVNNNMDNLIFLCKRCHTDIHRLGNKSTRNIAARLVTWPGEEDRYRSRPVLTGWKEARFNALDRDHYECILCPKTKRLVVHHMDGSGLLSKRPNNSMENLKTMCRGCHNAVTNLRNNTNRQLASKLIYALGPGTTGTPLIPEQE